MYYPRKTPSNRLKAFDMFKAGASNDEVAAALGLLPDTVLQYRRMMTREAEIASGSRRVALELMLPAGPHDMSGEYRAFELWVQNECVPAFFKARGTAQ